MKRMLIFILLSHFLVTLCYASYGPHGAAPNSGDGISDGSGFESPFGPNK